VLAIAQRPSEEIDLLFPDYITTGLTRLLLSVWDRNADALFQLIEYADMGAEAKWSLYDVLARLTFDGRIPREQTVEFLDRMRGEGLIDGGDMAWGGWEQAVVKLGLAEFEPALRRVWKKPIYQQHTEADHATVIEMLKRVAANPADSVLFDIEGVR